MNTDPQNDLRGERLNQLLSEYIHAVAAEQRRLIEQNPELAEDLQRLLPDQGRAERFAALPPTIQAEPFSSSTVEPDSTVALSRFVEAGAGADPSFQFGEAFGNYELIEEIGRGGMGVVYKARDRRLKRTVALKMILTGRSAADEEVKRFHAEAQAAASLQHPNIVTIYDVGERDNLHFFSMEYVEGGSLAELVSEDPLPAREAAQSLSTIARAVEYAHSQGVLHRDLKPSNILIANDDQRLARLDHAESAVLSRQSVLKVTDFGLAKRLTRDETVSAGLTAGRVLGTPGYMPPEQASAHDDRIGPASDVYSLGAILYELLTGRPPFRAATPWETLRQVVESEPAPPRLLNASVPRDLETICLKCLRKDPPDRYASALELAEDLDRWLNGEPIQARPVTPVERAGKWLWKRRRIAALLGGSAVAAALLVIGLFLGWRTYQDARFAWIDFASLAGDDSRLAAEVLPLTSDEPVVPKFSVPTLQAQRLPEGEYRLRLTAPGRLSQEHRLSVQRTSRTSWNVGLEENELWDPVALGENEYSQLIELDKSTAVLVRTERGLRRISGATGQELWSTEIRAEQFGSAFRISENFDWNYASFSSMGEEPHLLQPAPDINGDKAADIVWSSPRQPMVLAISGRDGAILWGAGVSESPGVAQALASGDIDGDASVDVLAIIASEQAQVVALSGRDGQTLWKHDVPAPSLRFGTEKLIMSRMTQAQQSPVLMVCVPGATIWINARTGERISYHSGSQSIEATADLNGDDNDDAFITINGPHVECWSLFRAHRHFRTRLPATPQERWRGFGVPAPAPQFVDFDRDGVPEFVLLIQGKTDENGLSVHDIQTGRSLWKSPLLGFHGESGGPSSQCQWAAGPDLNHDGIDELFLASLSADSHGYSYIPDLLFIDALSGKDGTTLWSSHQRLQHDAFHLLLWPLKWWRCGADGWPSLIVPIGPTSDSSRATTYVASAGDGRLEHLLPHVNQIHVNDLNGDGLTDLLWMDKSFRSVAPGISGKLRTVRGQPPDVWRRLEGWQAAEDFDGDRVKDFIQNGALSGADGEVLWKLAAPAGDQYQVLLSTNVDRHNEAAEIVLLRQSNDGDIKLERRSGGNGELLAPPVQIPISADFRRFEAAAVRDLAGQGQPTILLRFSHDQRAQIAAVSMVSGKLLWRQAWPDTPDLLLRDFEFIDLDGDGVEDVLGAAGKDQTRPPGMAEELFVLAVNGRNGARLWKAGGFRVVGPPQLLTVDSVQGNGSAPVPRVLLNHGFLVAFDARGEKLWTWRVDQRSTEVIRRSVPGGEVVEATSDASWRYSPSSPLQVAAVRREQRKAALYAFYSDGNRNLEESDFERAACAVELNLDGTPIEETFFPVNSSLRCADLNGDGADETVVLSDQEMMVWGGRLSEPPRWRWRRPLGDAKIVSILTPPEHETGLVVIRIDRSIFALDGKKGTVQWRSESETPFNSNGTVLLSLPEKAGRGKSTTPGLMSFFLGGPVVRQILVTSPDGRYLPPKAVWRPPSQRRAEDPRRVRPMWTHSPLPAWGPLLAVLGVAIGINLLIFLWRRGAPVSGAMLVVVTIAALLISSEFQWELIGLAVMLFLLVRNVRLGRWRAVAVLSACAVLVVACYMVAHFLEARSIYPGRQFSWDRWHIAMIEPLAMMGILYLPVFAIRRLWRILAARFRAYRQRRQGLEARA